MRIISNPLGQTHSPASSDHYSRLNFVLFREILKGRDGRMYRQRAKIAIITGVNVGRPCGS